MKGVEGTVNWFSFPFSWVSSTNIAAFVFEEVASFVEGVEVSKSEVGGGAMVAETVEISTTDEDEF